MPGSILFVGADPREFTGLVAHWENVKSIELSVHWARTGRFQGREAFAVANGAGADRAFAAVLIAPRTSAVCNIGFCGAVDESLRIGDVVLVTEVKDGEHSWPTRLADGPPSARGVVATIDHIAQTAAEKRNFRATGASILEMEAAGVARAAEDLGVPFYCIRAVSDLATEDFANDFNAALQADGRFSVLRLLTQLKLKELIELQKRTALASKKLGDFIAASTF